MTMKELSHKLPQFPWRHYVQEIFSHTNISDDEPVIVPALSYLEKFEDITKHASKTILSNYVVWNVIQDEIPNLSKEFRKIRNNYKNKVMGSHGQRKRWKICVSMTNDYLGDVIGETYSRKHFDKEKKALAKKMIVNVRKAFQENVDGLKWMDKSTIDAVQDKAHAMRDHVGYPNYYDSKTKYLKRFKKYKKVLFKADTLFANKLALLKMSHQRMLKKLRKHVDKAEWPLDPQTINAMYSFNENQMVIPAGILQPPFFHGVNAPRAMVYGAIGAILGHELTHGFDNTGRKFNKYGELTKNWWSSDSLKHFKKRSDCVEKQYSSYKVRGKYKLNGKLTLGENIADNGGFRASQKAYQTWLMNNKETTLPGLKYTNEQLFYISFAQAYCSNSRPTQDYLATLTDPHSDETFRVKGVLSNSKEFARAFQCPKGSPMNPKTKCAVWISDDVVQDETKTHGKLLPNKHIKEKKTKTSKSTKDKSSKTKSSNAKLSKAKTSKAKSKILMKKKKIVNKHPKKTKH
ncbi:endothelin-converting enzyme 1-like [Paramuricea clavata]|uniref:Endothelin-converting enzyme 1-like n=2 Tax=Paramuricea clavata TaxID=317549 RepID=A0A6S7HBN5_PARCT|nr:endothelin-converting enzyme 1-like [Paramuricea clavata]